MQCFEHCIASLVRNVKKKKKKCKHSTKVIKMYQLPTMTSFFKIGLWKVSKPQICCWSVTIESLGQIGRPFTCILAMWCIGPKQLHCLKFAQLYEKQKCQYYTSTGAPSHLSTIFKGHVQKVLLTCSNI